MRMHASRLDAVCLVQQTRTGRMTFSVIRSKVGKGTPISMNRGSVISFMSIFMFRCVVIKGLAHFACNCCGLI